jgi:hypothetical protein
MCTGRSGGELERLLLLDDSKRSEATMEAAAEGVGSECGALSRGRFARSLIRVERKPFFLFCLAGGSALRG